MRQINGLLTLTLLQSLYILQTSVADPERFDADPDSDPTFHADPDPDPKLFS